MTPQTTGNRFRIAMAAVVLGAGLTAPLSSLASASTTSAGHGHADGKKVKKVCNLITDPTDDAANAAQMKIPSLDIISADVATNATTLTAVIRVAKLTTGMDPQTPFGRRWQIVMAVPGANGGQLAVGVSDGPFGARDLDNIGGKVRLDAKTNSVYVSYPLRALATAFHAHILKGKTRLSQFVAQADAMIQEPDVAHLTMLNAVGLGTDQAPDGKVSPATYLAGAPSCVRVGS